MSWVVSAEGKGLDFALEIHVAGDRRKDLKRNVERFARLGIREYFLFDRGRSRLSGWRLEAGRRGYRAILPQQGLFASEVLGLELRVEGSRLRFHHDGAPVLEADEMIAMSERRARESEVQLAKESRLRAEESQVRANWTAARRGSPSARRGDTAPRGSRAPIGRGPRRAGPAARRPGLRPPLRAGGFPRGHRSRSVGGAWNGMRRSKPFRK